MSFLMGVLVGILLFARPWSYRVACCDSMKECTKLTITFLLLCVICGIFSTAITTALLLLMGQDPWAG